MENEGKLSVSEPALSVGGLVAGGSALVSLLLVFGVDLSLEQSNALLAATAVLAPIAAALITRGRVYSPATVARMSEASIPEFVPAVEDVDVVEDEDDEDDEDDDDDDIKMLEDIPVK